MRLRTVYGTNAIGRYISREQGVPIGTKSFCWVEVERKYDFEMLFYPISVETHPAQG